MSHAEQQWVSVIIPCYNQGHFLAEAIESVLGQTYPYFEAVVVDDGSTDNTGEVTARYPQARLVRQENLGLAAARNAGIRVSAGGYLVFLDADDLLLPEALEVGVSCLREHPECAFVSGHYHLIKSDGSPTPYVRRPCVEKDHFLHLLQVNYIGMHATVTYRRAAFQSVGDFNAALDACEDYELYLRVARQFPIYCHDRVVAAYRQHSANMSGDSGLMLRTSVSVLRSQWKHVKGNEQYEQAYRAGIRHWRQYFGEQLIDQVRGRVGARQWGAALRGIVTLLRYHPRRLVGIVVRKALRKISRGPARLWAKAPHRGEGMKGVDV